MSEKLSDSDFEVCFTNNSKEDKERSLEECYREDGGFLVSTAKADDKVIHKYTTKYPGLVKTCFRVLRDHMKNTTEISVYVINQGVKKLEKDKELVNKGKEIHHRVIDGETRSMDIEPVIVYATRYYNKTGGIDFRVLDEDLRRLDNIFQEALTPPQMCITAFMAGITTSQEWISEPTKNKLNEILEKTKRDFINSELKCTDFSFQ